MPDFVLEQAIYTSQAAGSFRLLARSANFLEDWLPEAERLCVSFGERPVGVACPRCVFAQPFGRRQVAIVQVVDQGSNPASRGLGYHVMILERDAYQYVGADPFLIADQFPPDGNVRGDLPALSLSPGAVPRRTVAELEKVLKRADDSAVLLGGAQALVDGGRVVFERAAPGADLIRGLWMLLPTTTRFHLWPASFAFGNALGFDALVVPHAQGEDYRNYLTEQQAGDYPQGSYEFNLQMAVEAGDQRELDALLSRRSRRETWRMGLLLLCLISVLVIVSKWLMLPSGTTPKTKSRPAVEQTNSKLPANPGRETKHRD